MMLSMPFRQEYDPPRLRGPETPHTGHVENDGVVNDAIDRRQRGHGIFEDAIPGGKHEIGGNEHRALLIALGQQREERLHLITVLLDIANVVQD
jgi:hypothetical protein